MRQGKLGIVGRYTMKTKYVIFSIGVIVLALFFNILLKSNSAPTPLQPSPTPSLTLGHRTKAEGCVASNALPDKACTPGAIIPSATKDQICIPGYAKSVRNVTAEEKNQVYAEYGVTSHQPGEYEIDHLIGLELGGSNDIANLWPEGAEPRPGFHEKDQVENYLHEQVCIGAMTLQEAQLEIASNWLTVYQIRLKK